jgi:nitroimidazol reductase NimA-like FMN-containing flavoprotein (pyridoxamine 5'-phosphate oxidase superfamily)
VASNTHIAPAAGERSRIRRHPDRSVTSEAGKILAEGMVAHVGFVQDGQPYVIPFSYHYDPADPQRLYLHGAAASRTLQHLAAGNPACICVTLVQGLVYSRAAMNHSMNYRSVVCFGRGRLLQSEERKRAVFAAMIARYFQGRIAGHDYETPTLEQLNATTLVEVEIEEISAKARSGGPTGPHDADSEAMGSSGVVELDSNKCPFPGAGFPPSE